MISHPSEIQLCIKVKILRGASCDNTIYPVYKFVNDSLWTGCIVPPTHATTITLDISTGVCSPTLKPVMLLHEV